MESGDLDIRQAAIRACGKRGVCREQPPNNALNRTEMAKVTVGFESDSLLNAGGRQGTNDRENAYGGDLPQYRR
jgi:hypothetical protein